MWIIINRTTKTVEGTNTGTIDPTPYWNADLFEIVVWDGVEPEVGSPDPRLTMTWEDVRRRRNRLLRESDWTQIGDSPLTADRKQTWKSYRKALRDLPQTYDDVTKIVWPSKPKEIINAGIVDTK